jgi:hypothetical protein
MVTDRELREAPPRGRIPNQLIKSEGNMTRLKQETIFRALAVSPCAKRLYGW